MTERKLKAAYEAITKIYQEARRRIDPDLVDSPAEYDDMRSDVTQGIYCALIVIYERNWSDVSSICNRVEEELHWWE